VVLSNFDTLVFSTKFDQYYNEPTTNVGETSYRQAIKLIPFPNPASSKICLNEELRIREASLYSMLGNFLGHLTQENNCFKTPANGSNGMYLIKVSLENGEVYFCKVQLQIE
jgi:hypothetical protein